MNPSDPGSRLPAGNPEYSGLTAEAVDAIEDLSGVHPGHYGTPRTARHTRDA